MKEQKPEPLIPDVSHLVTCELEGGQLTDDEFGHLWIMLVVAGNESTRQLLSGSLLALLEWPAERARFAADPTLVHSAVEELLRWVSPIMQFRRTAMCDTELEGQPIRAGDKVVLCYISANRDEAIFAQPDQLDIGRNPNPHVAFGVGPHGCLGGALARMEMATLLEEVLPYLDELEVAGPPVRLRSNFMSGMKSLPLRFVRR